MNAKRPNVLSREIEGKNVIVIEIRGDLNGLANAPRQAQIGFGLALSNSFNQCPRIKRYIVDLSNIEGIDEYALKALDRMKFFAQRLHIDIRFVDLAEATKGGLECTMQAFLISGWSRIFNTVEEAVESFGVQAPKEITV